MATGIIDNVNRVNFIDTATVITTIASGGSWTATQNCWVRCEASGAQGAYSTVKFDNVAVFYHPSGSISNVGYVTGNQVQTMIPCKKGTVVKTTDATCTVFANKI